MLAVLGVGMLFVIWRVIPADGGHANSAPALTNMRAVIGSVPALAGIAIALWASAANEVVNLVFGVWLSDAFRLQIAALAGASAVIGLAELGGESLVATITDRIGKPRAVAAGLAANMAASALLPWIGRTEVGALAGLFLFYISFEFLVVSQLPMMTEVVPAARATTIALNSIGFGIGRSTGAHPGNVYLLKAGICASHLDRRIVRRVRAAGTGRNAAQDHAAAAAGGLAAAGPESALI